MESHVSALGLTVRAGATPRREARDAAERFARQVLDRCDALLEQRWPGSVFVVRDLDVSVRLSRDHVDDDEDIDAVAAAIADHIAADAVTITADTLRTPSQAIAVVFRDQIEWRALHLESWSRESAADRWAFAPLEAETEPHVTLTSPAQRSRLLRVLACLSRRGTLHRTLAALPPDVLTAVAHATRPAASESASSPSVQRLDEDSVAREVIDAVNQILESNTAAASTVESISTIDRPTVASTRFGGCVYLLNVALDLSVGELLWRACLPEGRFLARAVASIVNTDDPVAPVLFGGSQQVAIPDVTLEQQREIAVGLLASFVDALRRRGAIDGPKALLQTVGTSTGRLFVASDALTGYPFFVLPAETTSALREAHSVFERAWEGLPSRNGHAPLMVAAGAAVVSALMSQIAGTLALLFAARVRFEPQSPDDTIVARYLAIAGDIVSRSEAIDVRLPMASIDIGVRRAGLDKEPGWVPWLGQRVAITYV